MVRLVPVRTRHRLALGAAVVAAVLLLVSPVFGRAPVGGQYRPLVPAEGLTSGCYPLPGGVVPDFTYVLRRDGDTLNAHGVRRRTVLHYDRVDGAQASATIRAQFDAAGVSDQVQVWTRDFDVPDDAVVRGEMVLDLPVVDVATDDPICHDHNVTKRFTPDLPDRS